MFARLLTFACLGLITVSILRLLPPSLSKDAGLSHIKNIWRIDEGGSLNVVGIFRYANETSHDVHVYRCMCGQSCALRVDLPMVIPARQSRCFSIRLTAGDVRDGRMKLQFMTDAVELVTIDWEFKPRSDSWDDGGERVVTATPDPMFNDSSTFSNSE